MCGCNAASWCDLHRPEVFGGQRTVSSTGKILRCMDCGLSYCDFPLDTTLPDEQWLMLHDSPGGVLCACCIVRRAAKLPGVIAVRAVIEFASHEGER